MLITKKGILLLSTCSATAALAVSKRQASLCTDIRDRVPWTQLTSDEKTSYINADLCLMALPSTSGIPGAVSRWDDLQWPHVVQTNWVHGVGAFLPFHRYYMTVHERLIKDECGYTGRMPFWDEVAEVANLTGSELWSEEYFGGDGTGTGRCIETGPFANLTLRFVANNGIQDHCLTRKFDQNVFSAAKQSNIDRCNIVTLFSNATSCWEASPHTAGHSGVGAIMSDPTFSPGDPVFYLHHSYLDKLWWEWQKLDPATRLQDMGGANTKRGQAPPAQYLDYFGDGGGSITTLNHTLFMTGLAPNATIGDIMDLNGPVICSEYVNA